ncbi:MAG: 3-isopropylmalate dehydratase small subunit [Prochlorotrichaceae cyanobacterium]|jgi:3-isopropylmalate/(R)-2-methylmalate dehydratase small subunit
MESAVKMIEGRAIPLSGNDIDTDRIIPARFLRCVTFDGLGAHAFEDDRAQCQGEHPFDKAVYQGASILLVNRNFGCGSSREHAPQALAKWGIKAIVGESFAEIFFGNCLAMGIPCLTASSETLTKVQETIVADPQCTVTIDVEKRELQVAGQPAIPLTLAEGPQQMLVGGTWDACGQLVAAAEQIQSTAARLPYLHWQSA